MKYKYILRFTSFIFVAFLMMLTSIPAGATASLPRQSQILTSTFTAYALLSNNTVTEENPISYTVDFHTPFASITEVDYYFIFSHDVLDQWEDLQITGDFLGGFGFLNPNPTPQTSRLLTDSCLVHPEVCDAFMDGYSQGTISISLFTGSGSPSVHISSMIIYVYGTTTKDVSIDIKPGSDTNPINTESQGKIPVAILSASDFDAPSMVDKTSLTFGGTGDEESLAFCNNDAEDINGDGLLDLVCHFYTQLVHFNVLHTRYATLKGNTLDGTPIQGQDNVTIVK